MTSVERYPSRCSFSFDNMQRVYLLGVGGVSWLLWSMLIFDAQIKEFCFKKKVMCNIQIKKYMHWSSVVFLDLYY